MRTPLIQGSRRIWRAASLAVSGAATVLTVGAFAVFAAAPAQAGGSAVGDDEGGLVGVFVVQPTTTQVNMAVTPAVVVKVEDSEGHVVSDYNGPVILKYAFNRLGAPLPTGNQVNAVDGTATFPELTFSAVGFGFELMAEIPGEPDGSLGPLPSPSVWNWLSGSDGASGEPSSPFDIVGQLLHCGPGEPPCQSQPVSSDGTSGVAIAGNQPGTLEATGGGFPTLSCTSVGGVVSFSSTLSKTIRVTLAGSLAGNHPLKSYNLCWGAPTPFTTLSGTTSAFNPANNEYEGLLPNCSTTQPAPCVQNRVGGSGGPVTIGVKAPTGDPHMTY